MPTLLLIILFFVILMSFLWGSILAYWFWWTRPPIIQSHEKINDIEYIINDTSTGDTVTVRVYLSTDTWNRKLWKNDSISINGILFHAKYYNTWLTNGYKYTQQIKKASKYSLSLKREWNEEIIKTIVPSLFSAKIPFKLYKNSDNIIPFIVDTSLIWEKIHISFSSLSHAPIIKDNQWYAHSESIIYGKIVNNTILLTSEDLKNFIPWNMKIALSNIVKQEDGTYVIVSEWNIELLAQ